MEPEGSLYRIITTARDLALSSARSIHYMPILKNHFNIIPSFTRRSSKWSLSIRFPQYKPCVHLSLPYLSHAPSVSSPELYLVMRLLNPLLPGIWRAKYFSAHPLLKHPQPMFLRQCQRRSFTPYKTAGKMIAL